MSFGSSKSKTSSSAQTEPWGPAVPYLTGVLQKAGSVGNIDITPDQMAAFQALKSNAAEGNPFAPDIARLASDSLNYSLGDQGQTVSDAYSALQSNLGGMASGDYLDPFSNPQMAEMLRTVGDDVQWRINRMFAGAGRDLSGANQGAVARGVTQAQLPLLLDQFNQQQQNQIAANQQLMSGASQTAGQQAQLDQIAQNIRAAGIGYGNEALNARNYAANQILNLDQQIQQLPYENLALLSSILLPAAGLGGTQDSKGTSKSSGWGISLSDERAKDDIAQIGKTADGLPIYRFRYKGDDRIHVGLMAQDVEEVHPEAVVTLKGGLKGVDYDMATRDAALMVRHALGEREAV